jgi:hypothetical protein
MLLAAAETRGNNRDWSGVESAAWRIGNVRHSPSRRFDLLDRLFRLAVQVSLKTRLSGGTRRTAGLKTGRYVELKMSWPIGMRLAVASSRLGCRRADAGPELALGPQPVLEIVAVLSAALAIQLERSARDVAFVDDR